MLFHVEHETELATPPVAAEVFGDRLPLAEAFAHELATSATVRGLIGPREVPRLWDRHIINCAVLTDLLPPGARLIDIGSGAGLPGLAVAIRRPDVHVTLVEPLLRRVTWLEEVVASLGLGEQVTVRRARAEEVAGSLAAPYVTARAVAPLDRLARWSLPLLEPHGTLLALKGRTAAEELAEHATVLESLGAVESDVVQVGTGVLADPVAVVRVRVGAVPPGRPRSSSRTRRAPERGTPGRESRRVRRRRGGQS